MKDKKQSEVSPAPDRRVPEETKAPIKPIKPATKEKERAKLLPLTVLAEAANVPAWELSALMMAAGWSEGKMLTAADFGKALSNFRKRPLGGGKL